MCLPVPVCVYVCVLACMCVVSVNLFSRLAYAARSPAGRRGLPASAQSAGIPAASRTAPAGAERDREFERHDRVGKNVSR